MLPADVVERTAVDPPARLGRAALFVFASTLAGGLGAEACAKPPETPPAAQPPSAPAASYGGPPMMVAPAGSMSCDDAGAR